MLLLSSQIVFLLLLVCSVQTREEYALHLMANAVSGQPSSQSQRREANPTFARCCLPASPSAGLPSREIRLDAASRAAHTASWSMRHPALESAAVSSFTGLFRA